MKILVCVKQVPDVNLVKMDPETGNLIRTGVPTMLNPLDGNALEAAVRVKEKYGAEITVITMGPPMAESTLRDCLAVGADRAVLISGRPFGGADTLSTSYAIAAAAAMEGSFDLVFAGNPDERPTAVIAGDDYLAGHIIQYVKRLGLKVPADLAVVGRDNIYLAAMLSPALTSVDFSKEEFSDRLVDTMLKLIDGQKPADQYIAVSLAVRESA